jgi:hypothetical protein
MLATWFSIIDTVKFSKYRSAFLKKQKIEKQKIEK